MGLNKELQERKTESAGRGWPREPGLGLDRTEKEYSWPEIPGLGQSHLGWLRGEEACRAGEGQSAVLRVWVMGECSV